MNSFYAIISTSPNIATQDSVAIGLVLFNGKTFETYFSEAKRKLSQRLLANDNIDLKDIIHQFNAKFNELNEEFEEEALFYESSRLKSISYFEYLNRYSNGIVQFSKPKPYLVRDADKALEELVQFLFNESIYKTPPVNDLPRAASIIREKLIERVYNKVHTNYMFRSKIYPSLHFDLDVDCIGKNGSLIGAKSLDFNQSLPTIDKKLSHFYTLIPFLAEKYNKSIKDNDFYLIAEEPQKINSKEHQIWEAVKTNQLIKVVDPEQSSSIAQHIEEKNASKFLEEFSE